MVVTWTAAAGRREGRPLACFFAIRAALDEEAPDFEREFGVAPGLRAALHAGPVISGEVGGSKRGAVLAAAGSMIGAVGGAIIGVPIPVIGPVVGAVLFACTGALAGAMLGEQWKGRKLGESWKVGQAAFWGRLVGTLAKTAIATAMAGIAIAACVI